MIAAIVNRADRMDDMLGAKIPPGGHHCLPRREAPNLANDLSALAKDCRATRSMDCAIDATSAKQGRVCGVHNRVGSFLRDVGGTVEFENFVVA